MGKKSSKRRKPKKGGGGTASSSNNTAAAIDDEDAFLEQAMQQAATEKAALDQIAIKEAAEAAQRKNEAAKTEEAKFVQEFTKEHMGDFIARTVAQRQQRSKSSSSLSSSNAWSHLPPDQAVLMTKWEKSMPASQRLPNTSAAQTLKNMNITPQFVEGIPIGNWSLLIHRMQLVGKSVYTRNVPKLQRGDYVEILPGNGIKWQLVGEKGFIIDYFADEDKWGMEMDDQKIGPSLVFAGNLKRVFERT
jgi:hypothetical protein